MDLSKYKKHFMKKGKPDYVNVVIAALILVIAVSILNPMNLLQELSFAVGQGGFLVKSVSYIPFQGGYRWVVDVVEGVGNQVIVGDFSDDYLNSFLQGENKIRDGLRVELTNMDESCTYQIRETTGSSGKITRYAGKRYLLLRKVIVELNLGQF